MRASPFSGDSAPVQGRAGFEAESRAPQQPSVRVHPGAAEILVPPPGATDDPRDPLTGLLTHSGFYKALGRVRADCRRLARTACVLLVDLDEIERVNLEHGHDSGDAVISHAAGLLRDVCGPMPLGRFSGKSFAVAMPEADAADGREMAERIRRLISFRPLRQPEAVIAMTASVGVAASGRGFLEHETEVVAAAARALASAKRAGRNEVRVWGSGDARPAPAVVDSRGLQQMATEFSRLQQQLRRSHLESICALVAAVEAKDPYTERHSMTVALYAESFAQQMRLPSDEVEIIRSASVLHDVGKIGIPDSILTKPGRLTPHELALVRQHPQMGVAILRHADFLRTELPLVLHHHERIDGRGYPKGLAGEAIPLGARIIHVADAIDAMLSDRSYKSAYTVEQVVDELQRGRGTQFDGRVADLAVSWIQENPARVVRGGTSGRPRLRAWGVGAPAPAAVH